jgi:hypothetical protein
MIPGLRGPTKVANFNDVAQIRILDLPGAVEPGKQALPLLPKDVGFADQDRDDVSMLTEATQNRLLSESFEASRGLIGTWNTAELMLRAYVEPIKWKGSDQFRSHLGMPIVAEHFYSLLSVVQQTLFAGYRPFQIDPAAGTTVDAAAAQEAMIIAQMKHCGFKGGSVKQECRHIVYDGLLYGTGAVIFGWQQKQTKVLKKRPKQPATTLPVGGGTVDIPNANEDEIEEYEAGTIDINQPVFEHVPIRRLRVAPDCRRGEIDTASWKGRLIYVSSYDLDNLRDIEGFNVPTREKLVGLTTPQKMDSTSTNPMDTQGSTTNYPIYQQSTTPQKAYPENYSDGGTVDPLAKKFEVFEYVTDTRLVWVLEGQYVLQNRPHNNEVRYRSFVFREAPDSFYGYGLGFWLTDYQRIAQGVVNAFFDDLNLNLMGTYTSPAGLNNTAQAQWIFPGKVFKSDGQNKVEPMTRNSIQSQEPLGVIEQIRQWAVLLTSAGVSAQGMNTGQAGTMRTPAGVNLMASGEQMKTQDLIDQICDNILVPWIEFCVEMNGKLKPSQLRMMLSQELGDAFKSTPLNVINGDYKVTISAGAKLQARHTIEQMAGFLVSLVQAPGTVEMLAVQAMKVDFKAFFTALLDSAGYPYRENIVVPMDDDDKKRWEMTQQQPAHDIEKIKTAGEVKKEVDNNQAENRMLMKTGEQVLKTHQISVEQDAAMRAERQSEIRADQGETSVV